MLSTYLLQMGPTEPEPALEPSAGRLSVRQLKAELVRRGIAHQHCVERAELEQLLLPKDAAKEAQLAKIGSEGIEALAARVGIDPLFLPVRSVRVGPHSLSLQQRWNAGPPRPWHHTIPLPYTTRRATSLTWRFVDTAADNTGSGIWPGAVLLAHWLLYAPDSPFISTGLEAVSTIGAASTAATAAPPPTSAPSIDVLELGCGVGAIPSTCLLLAGRLGPPATTRSLTLVDRSASLLELANQNLASNLRAGARLNDGPDLLLYCLPRRPVAMIQSPN